MTVYNLCVKDVDAKNILFLLGKVPYEQVFTLVNDLETQIKEQDADQEKATP